MNVVPYKIAGVLPQPIVDYPQSTTRCAVDLAFTRTILDNLDVRIILSHAGGTLPHLSERVVGGAKFVQTQGEDVPGPLEM